MRDQGLLTQPASGPPYRADRNLVEPLRLADGSRAVRKTFSDAEEYGLEQAALHHYAAAGSFDPTIRVIRVLAAEDARRILVLEHTEGLRLDHGWPNARPDEDVTVDLARAMGALWCPPGANATPLREWMRALWWPVPPNPVLPSTAVARAAARAEELLTDPTPAVQLHGDLHHENVYRTDDGGLTVIDPKNIAGHPAFDVVAQIWNPGRVLDHPDAARLLLPARVEVFADVLRIDADLLRAWVHVGCILSAAWYFEDDPEPDAESLAHAADCVTIANLFAL